MSMDNLSTINLIPFNITDNNLDEIIGFDNASGQSRNMTLALITDEAAPTVGDFFLLYGAEGDLRKVAFADMPGAGGGISNVVEDVTPSLGGPLDGDGFDLNDMGVQPIREQAAAEVDVAGQGQWWKNACGALRANVYE